MTEQEVATVLCVGSLAACIIGLVLGLIDNHIYRRRLRRAAARNQGV